MPCAPTNDERSFMRFQVERFLFWIIRILARGTPRGAFLASGRMFGRLAYVLDNRHRKVAYQNFETAYPGASIDQARKTIVSCYQFFGSYLFDMLTHFPKFRAERMTDFEYEGLEHLQEAYARGKGVIILTGHLGVWELMGMAHGFKGFPLGVIARKLDNPYLNSLLERLRTSTGNFVIYKTEGFRPLLRAMRQGKGVAILIDQNIITDDRIFVDFFGKPAATTPVVGLLKLKTDAAVIPAFAVPLSGNRYRFIYAPPLDVRRSADRKADVKSITQACTAVIEEQIRKNPDCWLWMHRRWKTRPEA